MSIAYYIAANKELPLGYTSDNWDNEKEIKVIRILSLEASKEEEDTTTISIPEVLEDEIKICNTMDELASTYVTNVDDETKSALKKQFKNSFIYEISPVWGEFSLKSKMREENIEEYKTCKKCIEELFKYIGDNLNNQEEIELYACYIDEESEKRNMSLDRNIILSEFELKEGFEIQDRQYVKIRR